MDFKEVMHERQYRKCCSNDLFCFRNHLFLSNLVVQKYMLIKKIFFILSEEVWKVNVKLSNPLSPYFTLLF